jgi:hypothetical protein
MRLAVIRRVAVGFYPRLLVGGDLFRGKELAMWDFGMLAIGVAFFAIAISYVKGCELLVKKEPVK